MELEHYEVADGGGQVRLTGSASEMLTGAMAAAKGNGGIARLRGAIVSPGKDHHRTRKQKQVWPPEKLDTPDQVGVALLNLSKNDVRGCTRTND